VLRSRSLARFHLGDRRVALALFAALLVVACAAVAYAIGTGDYVMAASLLALGCVPALLVVAVRRPYVFPYALFVVLVPFDNLLFIGGGETLTKVFAALSAAFIMLYVVRSGRLSPPPLAVALWLSYLGWCVLSLLWAADSVHAPPAAVQTATVVLFYVLLAVAPVGDRDFFIICGAIVAGGVLATAYGMYFVHSSPSMLVDGRAVLRVGSHMIDPNDLGNALLAPFALALAGALNGRTPKVVVASLATVAILVCGMLLTISREALIGAVIIAAVSIWLSRARLLGFAIGIPAVVAIPFLVPSIAQRMAEAWATGGAGRTSIWAVGLQAFTQRPWLGWGVGSWSEAFDSTYISVYQHYVTGWDRPPHDTLLRAGMELGVVGVLLWTAAYLAAFFQLRGIVPGDRLYPVKIALVASLCGYWFVSFFIDMAFPKYLWVVLGAVAQLRTVARGRAARWSAPP
jgi:O-antigen ligase